MATKLRIRRYACGNKVLKYEEVVGLLTRIFPGQSWLDTFSEDDLASGLFQERFSLFHVGSMSVSVWDAEGHPMQIEFQEGWNGGEASLLVSDEGQCFISDPLFAMMLRGAKGQEIFRVYLAQPAD